MTAVPTTPLASGDEEYSDIYQLWLGKGQPALLEELSEGWLRKVIFPDGEPVFVLVCSDPNYHRYMTNQRSWRRSTSLPLNEV